MGAYTTDQIKALKLERSGDPLARGYAAMNNQQFADSMNAPGRPDASVSVADFREYMLANKLGGVSLLGRVHLAAAGAVASTVLGNILTEEAKGEASALLSVVGGDGFFNAGSTIDVQSSGLTAVLEGLRSTGVINAPHKQGLLALGDNRKSRADELGLPRVNLAAAERAGR